MLFDADYQRHVSPRLRAAMDRLHDPQAVWDIFRDPDTIAEMKRRTAQKRPAVGAASAKLLALGSWIRADDYKKTFGKIALCVMTACGYVIDMKDVDMPEDPLFRKATRYRLRLAAGDAREFEEDPLLDRLMRMLTLSELDTLTIRTRIELERRLPASTQ